MRLILASQSPRRRQLLLEANYEFEVILPSESAESGARIGEPAAEVVARFAKQKAEYVAGRIESGIVIGCDTVADCDGQILGKPRDRNHAEQMLRLLRGREHYVHSGLCLWQRPDDVVDVSVDTTRLLMSDITDEELLEYLDGDQWIGKAGAFGYQDRTGWLEIEQGSESNVVGLPMELLKRMLAAITEG
jgi:septum formation protein